MKYKISKKEWDKLSDDEKKLYKAKGDDFIIIIEGMPDLDAMAASITALEGKNAELLTEKQKEQQKVKDAEAAKKQAEDEAKAKAGDVTALNASWQTKLDAAQTGFKESEAGYVKTITELTSGSASLTLASELAIEGSASVLIPHIKARLKTDYKDGKATVVVLDKSGKPSAMTLDELKEEFNGDDAFAAIVKGSSASGSGGASGKGSASNKSVNLGGDKVQRTEALKKKYPELAK